MFLLTEDALSRSSRSRSSMSDIVFRSKQTNNPNDFDENDENTAQFEGSIAIVLLFSSLSSFINQSKLLLLRNVQCRLLDLVQVIKFAHPKYSHQITFPHLPAPFRPHEDQTGPQLLL